LSGRASSEDQNAEFLDVGQIFIEGRVLSGATNDALGNCSTFELRAPPARILSP
jgi:hypothetical protein